MPVIESGTLIAGLAIAFVVAFGFILFRARKDVQQGQTSSDEFLSEIQRRASQKGFRFTLVTAPRAEILWTLHGSFPPDVPWVLEHHSSARVRGQSGIWNTFVYRSSEARTGRAVFAFGSRRNVNARRGRLSAWVVRGFPPVEPGAYAEVDGLLSGAAAVSLGDVLDKRWMLVSRDESLARRVFSRRIRELLGRIPPRYYSNSRADDNTWIVLEPGGLTLAMGVDRPVADHVDLILELGEALSRALRH
jgi:hypothetical protein